MNQRPSPVMRASLLSSWRGFASSFAAAPTAPSRSWFFHQPNGTFIARRIIGSWAEDAHASQRRSSAVFARGEIWFSIGIKEPANDQ
jgi:hypothetical protein